MCGRFTLFTDDSHLVTLFDIDILEGEHQPAYNQAPSQLIRAVVTDSERELTLQQWGLIPFWAKPSFRPLINARAETLTEKPSFRSSALRRRCLIPTNGYYEWKDGQPYFFSRGDVVMAMAGIYEGPHGSDDASATTAIVTRAASDELVHIHPRMPLFVPKYLWETWLDPQIQDKDEVDDLLHSMPPPGLEIQKVSKAVGNMRVTDPKQIFEEQ